ncbi:MAG: precorrin-6A synthase (deacetylating) [Alphaproteobacteria bacterium]
MIHLHLIGIGTGNPDHLTLQAIKSLNAADLVMIPRKGDSKADLAELRRAICADVVRNDATQIVEFDLPVRDLANPDYLAAVNDWHDAIATVWQQTMLAHAGAVNVALLVWGDPSLYDSSLRIAGRLTMNVTVHIIPGITSIQGLTSAHGIPLNELGAAVTITTGRQLQNGWPGDVDTLVIMLDGNCSFQHLDPAGVSIWWGAYIGMKQQITISGDLAVVGPQIVERRGKARAEHGWIMDIYLLRRNIHIT